MSIGIARRAGLVAAAVLLLGLCNGTRSTGAQQMLADGGAEEMGLIGSMRHQMQVVPMPGRPLFREQIVANENEPMMAAMYAPARPRRQADTPPVPSGVASIPAVAQMNNPLKPNQNEQIPKRSRRGAAGSEPSAPSAAPSAPSSSGSESFTDMANKQLANAGQTLKNYGDQLAAQIPKRLRRQATGSASGSVDPLSGKPLSGQAAGQVNSPLAALGEQLRSQSAAAVQSFQNFGTQLSNQLAASAQPIIPKRAKRQISYPSTSGLSASDPPQQPQTSQQPQSSEKSGIMKYLSDLGQQAQQAQAIQQFISAATNSQQQPQPSNNPLSALAQLGSSSSSSSSSSGSSGGLSSVAQMMAQLTDLIKSTQERNSRLLESSQRSLESTNQQTMEAARSAQGGIASALSEMGQGLQRLAANNPNLLPDIKSLYQSVSSKLSSASSSVAQTATGNQPEQLPSLPVAQS